MPSSPFATVGSALHVSSSGLNTTGEAQIDGSGVERVCGLLQVHAERLGSVELPGLMDEDLREVGVDPPIPFLVGDGQGVAADP